MLNKCLQILLSLMLSIAIVSPVLMELSNLTSEISLLEDVEEHQKDNKKELEIKDVLFCMRHEQLLKPIFSKKMTYGYLSIQTAKPFLEVFSPPPEV